MSERFIDTPDFVKVIKKIKLALKNYPWAMIGGRAVEVHANPPQTPDIDILATYKAGDMRDVIDAMEDHGFKLERKFFDPGFAPMLFFTDTKTKTEVDVIGAFEDVHFYAVERAVNKKVGGVSFPVITAEDLVILKAQAAVSPRREDKAERDKAAIKAIADEVKLDSDYIETVLTYAMADWSEELALLKKLGVVK